MVYIFLADGFEEIEALGTADILRRAGIEVKLCSVAGEYVTGSHGITVKSDILLSETKDSQEMYILPGGMPGVDNLWKCEELRNIFLRNAGGRIAAICAAPMILGRLRLLEGKRAVCYPGYEHELIGASVSARTAVETDGNIITAVGAGATADFALCIVRALKGETQAAAIGRAMFVKLHD